MAKKRKGVYDPGPPPKDNIPESAYSTKGGISDNSIAATLRYIRDYNPKKIAAYLKDYITSGQLGRGLNKWYFPGGNPIEQLIGSYTIDDIKNLIGGYSPTATGGTFGTKNTVLGSAPMNYGTNQALYGPGTATNIPSGVYMPTQPATGRPPSGVSPYGKAKATTNSVKIGDFTYTNDEYDTELLQNFLDNGVAEDVALGWARLENVFAPDENGAWDWRPISGWGKMKGYGGAASWAGGYKGTPLYEPGVDKWGNNPYMEEYFGVKTGYGMKPPRYTKWGTPFKGYTSLKPPPGYGSGGGG